MKVDFLLAAYCVSLISRILWMKPESPMKRSLMAICFKLDSFECKVMFP